MATIASLRVPITALPQANTSWLDSLATNGAAAIDEFGNRKAFGGLADRIGGAPAASMPVAPQTAPVAPSGAAQTGMTAPVMPVDRGPIPNAYFASIRSAESGGNDAARNPKSSATGRYQFTAGTWDTLSQAHPELGLTADGRLDPSQQERAIRAFTQDNAHTLSGAGIPVNPGNLYAAHFLGAGGARSVLTQDDAAPISSFVDPDVVKANPFLNGMTVGQFKEWAASKGGNGQGGYTPTSVDAVNSMAQGSSMPSPASNVLASGMTPIQRGGVDPETIQYMLRSPQLREVGLKLWAANAGQQKAGEPWQFVTLPDGTLARANQQTGAVERLGNFAKPDNETTVVGEDLVRKSDGKVIYQGQPKTPQSFQEFKLAQQNGFQGSYADWEKVKAPGVTVNNNPKLTEDQGKVSGFLTRARQSEQILQQLEGQGTNANSVLGKAPLIGNFIRSEDGQRYDQAKRDFVNAVLRRESGAVISPEEFSNAEQQYFPQPGDGPRVIEQKRANRDAAIRGFEISAGPGADLAYPNGKKPGTVKNTTSTGVEWSIEP